MAEWPHSCHRGARWDNQVISYSPSLKGFKMLWNTQTNKEKTTWDGSSHPAYCLTSIVAKVCTLGALVIWESYKCGKGVGGGGFQATIQQALHLKHKVPYSKYGFLWLCFRCSMRTLQSVDSLLGLDEELAAVWSQSVWWEKGGVIVDQSVIIPKYTVINLEGLLFILLRRSAAQV